MLQVNMGKTPKQLCYYYASLIRQQPIEITGAIVATTVAVVRGTTESMLVLALITMVARRRGHDYGANQEF